MTMPSAAQTLRDDIAIAAQAVPPAWPLSSTIAVNPLAGLEHLPFDQALATAEARFGARGHLTLAEYRAAFAGDRVTRRHLDDAIVRKLGHLEPAAHDAVVIDLLEGPEEPQPTRWTLTVAEQHDAGHATRLRAALDIEISDWCARWATHPEPDAPWPAWQAAHRQLADALPQDPAAAVLACLASLRVPDYARHGYLTRHLTALPGWAGHLRWREQAHGGEILLAHLAWCLAFEVAVVDGRAWFTSDGPAPKPAATLVSERAAFAIERLGRGDAEAIHAAIRLLPSTARELLWHDAYERAVQDPLVEALNPVDARGARQDRPDAQLICCIDVRSEGLRRNLEARGRYETFGYAGFFGLAARVQPLGGGEGTDRCPVLLRPSVELSEIAGAGEEQAVAREVERRRSISALDDAWTAAKYHPIAPLALAEGAGWVAGPVAAARTAAPGFTAWAEDRLPWGRRPSIATTYDRSALDEDGQADLVAAIIDLGLGPNPARLVVVCGHDARVDNNPVESGLACGACGGHGGAPNARAVAAMANDPAIRAVLAARGEALPADTWFVAAEHDTATDRVAVLDQHLVPTTHTEDLARLVADLAAAGDEAVLERADALPGRTGARRSRARRIATIRRRARDWAEPVAELGLAGNHAFIAGPRSLTEGIDLGRRAFLHSYDAGTDPHGTRLAGILTAPLIVAHWINAQYFFSTTDPDLFGSGTKAVHNVLGDIGVLDGPGGDLRRGLPLQSVRAGDRLLHEPIRLLAVIVGRTDHIDATLGASSSLRQLVDHEWITLVAPGAEPDDPRWLRRLSSGWEPHLPARPSGPDQTEAAA